MYIYIYTSFFLYIVSHKIYKAHDLKRGAKPEVGERLVVREAEIRKPSLLVSYVIFSTYSYMLDNHRDYNYIHVCQDLRQYTPFH